MTDKIVRTKPETPAEESTESSRTPEEIQKQFQELIESPISKEEADKGFADLDVKHSQLAIIRQKWLSQAETVRQQLTQIQQKISMLDEEILNIGLERAVIFRRALNIDAEAAADKEG